MSKSIKITITVEELGYIVESLEQFADATPSDFPELKTITSLFRRLENKLSGLNGEPEEGY